MTSRHQRICTEREKKLVSLHTNDVRTGRLSTSDKLRLKVKKECFMLQDNNPYLNTKCFIIVSTRVK